MICWHGCKTYEEHKKALLKDKEFQKDCLARWVLDNFNDKEERRAWLGKATKRIRSTSGNEAAEIYYNDMAARVLRVYNERKGQLRGNNEKTMYLSR